MEPKEKIEKEVVKAEGINMFSLADGKNVTVYVTGDPDHPVVGRVMAPKGSQQVLIYSEDGEMVAIPHTAIMRMIWRGED